MGEKRQYRFIEHTADVEFVALGANTSTCFKNALMAMFETMAYTDKVARLKSKVVSFTVKDKAKTIDDLLWYALQDTLSLSESKEIFAYKVSNMVVKDKRIYIQ